MSNGLEFCVFFFHFAFYIPWFSSFALVMRFERWNFIDSLKNSMRTIRMSQCLQKKKQQKWILLKFTVPMVIQLHLSIIQSIHHVFQIQFSVFFFVCCFRLASNDKFSEQCWYFPCLRTSHLDLTWTRRNTFDGQWYANIVFYIENCSKSKDTWAH